MDYEKKYKEALERAKRINDGDGIECPSGWTTCEVIFPELKESEDANIRGAIIDYLKDNNLTEWAAWLEKQGEQEKFIEKELGNIRGYREEALRRLQELEKQKEPEDKGEISDGTQAHVDKVESKFRVGDWITDDTRTFQIVKIEDEWYIADDGDKVCFDVVHQYYHLWTIQDAKDGDVLAGEYDDCKKPWIGIFKCFSENRPQTQFDSYCFITSSRHEFITPDSCDFCNRCKGHTAGYTKPATKEQRDMLFQKMHEAGYEWDADRKELKELSQSEVTKMDDQEQKSAWSAKDEMIRMSIITDMEKMLRDAKVEQYADIISAKIKWLESLKDRIK